MGSGLSMDGRIYSGIHGSSDKGVGEGEHPWTIKGWSSQLLWHPRILRMGGSEGWTSLDYPWMVTNTLSSTNTLTWVGGERGHPWTIHGWSHLLWHLQIL